MATDAEDTPEVSTRTARPGAALPWEGRFLVTIFLLALYYFGHRLNLPLVNPGPLEISSVAARLNLLGLGFTALFSGFILVELFSVITSPGRRLRQAGSAGRARLNRAALGTSLVLAALQGLGIAFFLETTVNPAGEPFVPNPGLGFLLVMMATITGATAAVFVLANLLSDYGIGNGFALLNLVEIGLEVARLQHLDSNLEASDSPESTFWLLGLGVLTFLLIRQIRGGEATNTPGIPQGILPVGWSGLVLGILISRYWGALPGNPWMLYAGLALVGVSFFSWLCFHLFSSRARLEANLSETAEVLDGLAVSLRRRLPLSTALLAAGTVAFMAWQRYQLVSFLATSGFLSLVVVIATGFDIVEQYRFMKRNGLTTRLIQLDNVYFSYRLTELLDEDGIDSLARGHVLRSLYFFLGPLYKIDVLVPVEDLEAARKVLAELEAAREAKVF